MGRDLYEDIVSIIASNFNSHARVGRDLDLAVFVYDVVEFQLTRPRGA